MTEPFDFDAMLADREAGTEGPWEAANGRVWTPHGKTMTHLFVCAADRNRVARVPAMEAEIIRLRDAVDRLEATNLRWQSNSRDAWQAMSAMRNSINEYIPMPSIESDLPATSQFCATVEQEVVGSIALLTARAEKAEAERDALRAALYALHHAVCGETGFANAVRTASGLAYPWPALDAAEESAISAMKDTEHD